MLHVWREWITLRAGLMLLGHLRVAGQGAQLLITKSLIRIVAVSNVIIFARLIVVILEFVVQEMLLLLLVEIEGCLLMGCAGIALLELLRAETSAEALELVLLLVLLVLGERYLPATHAFHRPICLVLAAGLGSGSSSSRKLRYLRRGVLCLVKMTLWLTLAVLMEHVGSDGRRVVHIQIGSILLDALRFLT